MLSDRINNKGRIAKDSAKKLLASIHFKFVSEKNVMGKIRKILNDSSLGIDIDAAFNCLCWWIYEASEQKQKLTKKDTINEIDTIGKFLTEVRFYPAIVSISDYIRGLLNSQQISIRPGIYLKRPWKAQGSP